MATTDRPVGPAAADVPLPGSASGRDPSLRETDRGSSNDAETWDAYDPARRRFLLFTAVPSWMISLVVHMVGLFLLAIITLPDTRPTQTELVVAAPDPVPEVDEAFHLEETVEVPEMELNPTSISPMDSVLAEELEVETPDIHFADALEAAPIQIDLTEFAERTAPKNALSQMIGSQVGSGIAGRGVARQADMAQIKKWGGTEGSEAAVAAALRWIAYHQLPDGGWSFDHTIGPGPRFSPNPGDLRDTRNAATAMALLPFLGAGQTHLDGEYKEVVRRGLYFLMSRQQSNGSFAEAGGRLYSHGLAAIALCEAYAMTGDPDLAGPAQGALNFIVYAQDPVGGGWRYEPRQAGDTSVVGWQLMALKSGHMGELQVPPNVIAGTSRFLDSVQTDGGAKYGYTAPGAGIGTTAVGLLCRMYLGWKQDHPALMRGVKFLSDTGPSTSNMYYNYYATQVMRHNGGEMWEKWNSQMREFLVKTQSREGPSQGSWYIPGDHGSERGGRLYCTSMATMILEVYYRHMPIYGSKAADEEFPL